jgi:hypothetical protein
MTRSQISDLKQEFIRQRQAFMRKHISAAEKKLYDQIYRKVISNLELDGGSINSTGKNLNLASDIDAIYKDFNKKEYTNILKQFSADLAKIASLNGDYFRVVAEDTTPKRFDSVKKEVKDFMSKRVGLNSKDEIVKGGYLDRLISDESLKNSIKDKILKGITNKKPVTDLVKTLEKTIVGNPNVDGGLVRHFNQHMHDTYNQFDRTTSMKFAERLDLQFFIYQGGKIKTSRPFCVKRDGKCFTTQEAEQWKSLIGSDNGPMADKNDYNPLVDCGGFNCRHSIDYISDSLAKRYRPDMFN